MSLGAVRDGFYKEGHNTNIHISRLLHGIHGIPRVRDAAKLSIHTVF